MKRCFIVIYFSQKMDDNIAFYSELKGLLRSWARIKWKTISHYQFQFLFCVVKYHL